MFQSLGKCSGHMHIKLYLLHLETVWIWRQICSVKGIIRDKDHSKQKNKKVDLVLLSLFMYTNGLYGPLAHIKRKNVFKHIQNVQIQIILHMCKVSSGPLLSIHTFCSIQQCCYQTVKALIRLHKYAGWSGPSLSAYTRHILACYNPYVQQWIMQLYFLYK